MREIKFRGKRRLTGEWVYGFYVRYDEGPEGVFHVIQHSNGYEDDIISETVGQYTGLKDKNGKEIYEGDVVRASSEGVWGIFEVKWRQEGLPCFILYPAFQKGEMWKLHGSKHKDGHYYDSVEVIGNIYESPGLRKEVNL